MAVLLVGVGALSKAAEEVRLKAEVDLALAEGKVDKIVHPFFESTALIGASQIGYEYGVRKLLDAGADIEKRGYRGTGPIHSAAMNGHTAILRILIQRGAELDALSEDGFTALTYAAFIEHDALIFELLRWGANESLAIPPLNEPADVDAELRETIDDKLAEFQKVGMSEDHFRDTIKSGSMDEVSEGFILRLIDYAIGIGHVHKPISFYAAHYNDSNYDEAYDTQPSMLHISSKFGYMDAMGKLLNDVHADPNARSSDGLTPLHAAARATPHGQSRAVHVLARHGADIDAVEGLGTVDGLGRALHTAAERGYPAVVRALLARGADPTPKDESGNTALDLATDKETRMLLKNGGSDQVEAILERARQSSDDAPQCESACYVALYLDAPLRGLNCVLFTLLGGLAYEHEGSWLGRVYMGNWLVFVFLQYCRNSVALI